MKTVFFALLFIVALTAFTSCESCLQCSYTYLEDGTGEEMTFDYGTQCSDKKSLQDYEARVKFVADSLGGTHVCIEQ